MDPRYHELAHVLTDFSTNLKKGENVLIDAFDVPDDMVIAIVQAARKRRAIPFVELHQARITRELYRGGVDEQYRVACKNELRRVKQMDAYIALRGANNIFELSDIPAKKMKLAASLMKPVLDWRVKKTKWVVLRWPTPAMAQQALQSTESFEDFYFRVCTLDYSRMVNGMNALKRLMEKTDKVEIRGPGARLSFSIKEISAICCGGTHNIPDGEVFTSPVKTSVEGEITFNTASVYQGNSFDNVHFVFKKGKIVEASASGNKNKLKEILDADAGARFIGEFSIAFNPHIREPMCDILFDEKIAGSFHFTPGQAYEEADNGNRSQIHWDLVSIQRSDYGGGEIYFDGKLIRKNGLFLPRSLQKLNPDYLLG